MSSQGFGKGKEPAAELSLNQLDLQLIPNTEKSILTLIQNNQWQAAIDSLDFLWANLPPKTIQKFKDPPSVEIALVMQKAKVEAERFPDPSESGVRNRQRAAVAASQAGRVFCFEWLKRMKAQLNADGYLFESTQITPTADRKVSDQPPGEAVSRTLPRS